MKKWPYFFAMAFLLSHCSQKESGKRDPLAEEVWKTMIDAEAKAQFQENLEPGLLGEHRTNTDALRDKIPEGYPEPYLPYGRLSDSTIDFPLSRSPFLNADIIYLGEKLFFDQNLSYSVNHSGAGAISCSSCHLKDQAFADPRALSQGVEGDFTRRNAPTLLNVAYNSTLTWANPVFPALEMQAKIPMFGNDPIEMGLRGREGKLFDTLIKGDPEYITLFAKTYGLHYPEDQSKGLMDYSLITAALAAYERSLIRFDTKFDRFLSGKLSPDEALTDQEKSGMRMFYGMKTLASGDKLPCSQCHAGILMSDSFHYVREGRYYNSKFFHNTGMYNLDGKGAYPEKNTGYANARELEEKPSLMGQFRTPSLRFVGQTAPYAHDGTMATLDDVIRHYAAGGQANLLGQYGQNPFVDELIKPGFDITDSEISDLKAFLLTLQ